MFHQKNKSKSISLVLCAVAGISYFSSCATTKSSVHVAAKTSPVYVTNTKKIQVLTTDYMEGDVDALYVFSADFGKQNLSTLSYLYSSSEELSLTLMTDFGADMGALRFDGEHVDFSLPIKANIKGEYIVADLENIFYPAQALTENYSSKGLTFSVSEESGLITRTISSGKNVIEKITLTLTADGIPEKVVLKNLLRGYTYRLDLAEE